MWQRVFINSTVPHICITDPTVTPHLSSLKGQEVLTGQKYSHFLTLHIFSLVCYSEHGKCGKSRTAPSLTARGLTF